MQQTFTDFKNDFYKRVPDLTLFDCGDINLLKVVLDGLKVNYVSKGKINTYLFYPLFIYNAVKKIKLLRLNTLYKSKKIINVDFLNQTYLVSDVGRMVTLPDGSIKSLYFDNIVKSLGRDNVLIVTDKLIDDKLEHDLNINEIFNYVINLPLTKDEILLRKNILKTFNSIKHKKIFAVNELQNIKIAFQLFFNQYKVWSYLLKNFTELKTAYFICHYHKEGQIYALKKHKITCVELQHGLIAPQDIFYIFPKSISQIKHKTLFADKIYVYGQYWKNLLLTGQEYDTNQIDVLGYYLFDDFSGFENEKSSLNKLVNNKHVILITTQTYLHQYFIDFAKQLELKIKERELNSIILLKTHPAENIDIYINQFKNSEIVKVIPLPLPLLLKIADINISIYSTTLYDALRFGVKNFVFQAKGCEDYTNQIIKSGIATPFSNFDELLHYKNDTTNKDVKFENFYSIFNNTILKCN